MSATGRTKKDGTKTKRRPHDFYATPAWCVERLLANVDLPGGRWLEPGAGDGAIIRAVNAVRNDVTWTAVELRSQPLPSLYGIQNMALQLGHRGVKVNVLNRDFLASDCRSLDAYPVALGNPPYSLAAPFIRRALECAEQVVFLLRLNLLGSSNKRRELFEQAGVPDIYVLPERPSFTGKGTDACEYAWMRWTRDARTKGEVKILFKERE